MKVLIDTNVMLDILQRREPFYQLSYGAVRKAIEMETECLFSSSAVTDIFYVLRRALGSTLIAKQKIEELSLLVCFTDVLGLDIRTALLRNMGDFEDAVIDAVAQRSGADFILTRNVKDFKNSKVPAILPSDFLDLFR